LPWRLTRGGASRPLPPGFVELTCQPGELGFEAVQLEQQRVSPPRLDLASPLALVEEQTEFARRVVAFPAGPHELDLQLALVQRRLRLLRQSLELMVEPIE
jgi:hypothetical protein